MSTSLSWIILVVLFTYCLFKFRLTRIRSYLATIKLRVSFKVFVVKEQFLALFVSILIKTISLACKMYGVIFMIHRFSKNSKFFVLINMINWKILIIWDMINWKFFLLNYLLSGEMKDLTDCTCEIYCSGMKLRCVSSPT